MAKAVFVVTVAVVEVAAVVVVKVIRCCVYVMVSCSCHRNVCLRTQGFYVSGNECIDL